MADCSKRLRTTTVNDTPKSTPSLPVVKPSVTKIGTTTFVSVRASVPSAGKVDLTYRVRDRDVLGRGAFGSVMKATVEGSHRHVAVKTVLQDSRFCVRLQCITTLCSHIQLLAYDICIAHSRTLMAHVRVVFDV